MKDRTPVVANRADHPDGVLHVLAVVAWRKGRLWRIEYASPCPDCGKKHMHGGGDGDEPFMGDGIWYSHCVRAPLNVPLVRLVLSGPEGTQ